MNPNTGQMTSRELLKSGDDPSTLDAAAGGFMQGYALSGADEMLAGIARSAGGAEGGEFARERARASFEVAQERHPVAFGAGRVVGAVLNPMTRAAPATTTVGGAAAVAGGEGLVEGFLAGEGGAAERGKNAAREGAISTLFGGAAAGVLKGGSKALRAAFKRSQERPSIDALRAAKNQAYYAVRKSGIQFDGNDMTAAFQRLQRKSQTSRWDLDKISEVDKPAFDAMRVLERRANAGRPFSLDMLDKTRQKLWDIYRRTDHPFVLEAIGELDDTIAQKASGSDLLANARVANSRFAKAQLLENAFRKAQLETAATGSGGNILNKYRQAVVRILNNPREAKWFSDDEIKLMEGFVMGGGAENLLRRAGKLAPGGNGLMTALNVYAASVDPAMLGITAAAEGAKRIADNSAMKGAQTLRDSVATGVIRRPDAPIGTRDVAVGVSTAARDYFQ